MRDVHSVRASLLRTLESNLADPSSICSEWSLSHVRVSSFYSPFVLSSVGIVLSTLANTLVSPFLMRIRHCLTSTPNRRGIFDFYGSDEYPPDVDTTALANIFLTLQNSVELPLGDVRAQILAIQHTTTGAIRTWFDPT
ncbi:MAG TPA: hypothetical protein VM163_06490, partial [bacterium]|nr:hypothetical protein [bacterium]